ncbi:TNT domain-containing protein [Pseudomonas capsici]|nr:TNT domain-containing protein [Pseudomonas capsici]
MQVDRFGYPGGNYISPLGASFGERALPSSYEATKPYFQYEVIQPIPGVTQAKVLPWFGQPGMGTQFQLPNSIQWYLDNGFLNEKK